MKLTYGIRLNDTIRDEDCFATYKVSLRLLGILLLTGILHKLNPVTDRHNGQHTKFEAPTRLQYLEGGLLATYLLHSQS